MNFILNMYQKNTVNIVSNINVEENSGNNNSSSLVIYFVKEGDTLWQIGRKYYVSVDKIKEVNQLTSEDITPGDKLLIVKSGEI